MLRKYYELFREAAKLDIFDLAIEFSYEPLNTLAFELSSISRKGVIQRLSIFFWHLLKSAAQLSQRKGPPIPPGSRIFFVLDKNEKDSLLPVFVNVDDAYWVGYGTAASNSLSLFRARLLSCLYLPLVLMRFIKSKGYQRSSFSHIFDHYLMIYGLYIVSRAWLERIRPKALIVSNALHTYHRVVVKAAHDESIATFYLQHASTPDNSPPLAFDYALLEGHDSLQTHARFGLTQTRVFLIGVPKHDPHFHFVNTRPTVSSIGICTSTLDPLSRAAQLCAAIRQEFAALPIVLRPHAGDLRINEWKELAERYDLQFSDAKRELSFDFLKRVDLIIAGNSNILLEAALMNVVPLYYDFAEARVDYYGFQRNGLVECHSEPDEVCNALRKMLQDKPAVRMKAKRYCATVGTRYDGHSGEIAAALIQDLVSNDVVLNSWQRIPNIDAEAYELTCDQDSV